MYLIRHGETDHNRNRVFQGHGPVPLNDLGIRQAALLGRRMRDMPLDRIVASDLARTAMTAGIIAAETGRPVIYDPAWRERNPGDLTGESYDAGPGFWSDRNFEPPNGESQTQFEERVRVAFEQWAPEQTPGSHIAVVTHGMVCVAFARLFLSGEDGVDFNRVKANASITIADYEDGAWKLVTYADASHLDDLVDPQAHYTGA
jgi:probable phosphoglycerate mutase